MVPGPQAGPRTNEDASTWPERAGYPLNSGCFSKPNSTHGRPLDRYTRSSIGPGIVCAFGAAASAFKVSESARSNAIAMRGLVVSIVAKGGGSNLPASSDGHSHRDPLETRLRSRRQRHEHDTARERRSPRPSLPRPRPCRTRATLTDCDPRSSMGGPRSLTTSIRLAWLPWFVNRHERRRAAVVVPNRGAGYVHEDSGQACHALGVGGTLVCRRCQSEIFAPRNLIN